MGWTGRFQNQAVGGREGQATGSRAGRGKEEYILWPCWAVSGKCPSLDRETGLPAKDTCLSGSRSSHLKPLL